MCLLPLPAWSRREKVREAIEQESKSWRDKSAALAAQLAKTESEAREALMRADQVRVKLCTVRVQGGASRRAARGRIRKAFLFVAECACMSHNSHLEGVRGNFVVCIKLGGGFLLRRHF